MNALLVKLGRISRGAGAIKYVSNMSWLFLEKVFRMFIVLVLGVWVARYLGPEQFGVFSYVQSFIGLLIVIPAMGLDGIVVRELVRNENKRDRILGSSIVLRFFGCLVLFVVLIALINVGFASESNNENVNLMMLVIAMSCFLQTFNVIGFYFESKVLSKYTVYASVFSMSISSLLTVFLILNEAPLLYFAYAILFDSLTLAVALIYIYRHKVDSLHKWFFDRDTAKSLLKDSWPLIISSMIIAIYMKIDQVMIKEMLGVQSVGQYAAAVKLSEGWYFIPTIIASSLFPAIIKMKGRGELIYYAGLQNLFNLMVWLGLLAAILVTAFSEDIIFILYGIAYSDAASILVVHVWAGLFVSLGLARAKWLLVENLQSYAFKFLGVGLFVNIFCNFYFIEMYGVIGAAYATLLAQIIGTFVMPCFFKKTRVTFFMMLNSLLLYPSILGKKRFVR